MTQTAAKPQPETAPQPAVGELLLPDISLPDSRELQAERFRLLWERRRFLLRATGVGLLASTLIALLIPKSYTSTVQLMPPDQQQPSMGLAMMAAMATKAQGSLGTMAGDLLGIKSSGAVFVGVLRSQTAQDRLVRQFDLRKVYGKRLVVDTRKKLDDNTSVSEDRKSGIISISVTDHNPQRAAALANAYVDQLNSLVVNLSTSSAHRERVFLEERLKVAKVDLDDATKQLAQFSSKNTTLDIQQEGKAMLDAAGMIAAQLIAGESQLEGLRQIYTDNNSRVRAMQARVAELRKELEKLGGTRNSPRKTTAALHSARSQSADPQPSPTADPPGDTHPGRTADASLGQAAADPPADLSPEEAVGPTGPIPYPTIRSLPLLGAKYSDYYRRAKIQETVFELLTEQYELAKVQEAKETPSVKVLDPGTVPEKKSFPPILLLMFLGTVLALSTSVVWVLGSNQWRQADPNDPRKMLAQEIVATAKARITWSAKNGDSTGGNGQGSGEG